MEPAFPAFERLHRPERLLGAVHDDPRQLSRAGAHRVDVVEPQDRGRRVDRVHQDAIVALFDEEKDPISVIKWKEIFDFLEAATDRCEDVGNLLEGVVVKHG